LTVIPLELRMVNKCAVEPSGNLPKSDFSKRFIVKVAALAPSDAQSITAAPTMVNPTQPKKFNLGNIGPPSIEGLL